MSAESGRIEKEDIASIMEKIEELPAAKRTALKRCCGKLLRDADAGAAMAFYQVYSLPEEFKWARERLFAVVCMRCLWDVKGKKEEEQIGETKKEEADEKRRQCRRYGIARTGFVLLEYREQKCAAALAGGLL